MTISLVILSFNRAEFLERSMAHNFATAGDSIDELIWVDNGSSEDVHRVMRPYRPDVCVLNKNNLGVSKGNNRGFALATSDFVLLIGPDMLMPDQWLATFKHYLRDVPNTGVACVFHHDPGLNLAPVQVVGDLPLHPCCPWAANRIVSRHLLTRKIGYLREDFGLYGWEDVEWGYRAKRVCDAESLLTYAIPGPRAEHLGTPRRDPADYRSFKRREVRDSRKTALLRQCKDEEFPYYNPFA